MRNMKQNSNIALTGYLTVSDRDKSGNILQVAIDSDEFISYIIETDQTAQLLFSLVDKRLNIKGEIIGENEKGNPIIKVSEYKLLS